MNALWLIAVVSILLAGCGPKHTCDPWPTCAIYPSEHPQMTPYSPAP
jgi:hypothetical protein